MSSARAVIQLVPHLGGLLDGVADYARMLGEALRSGARVRSRFLCGDPGDPAAGRIEEIDSGKVRTRSEAALVECLRNRGPDAAGDGAPTVLLHYVNYGYASRGCPFWLIRGLRAWKRQTPGAHLVTMFHELYAFGPPWRSAFWLSPVQRRLARELFALSDAAATNRMQSGEWLSAGSAGAGRPLAVMPVFSCLGEPESVPDWPERRPQMIVAGRSGSPERAYGRRSGGLLHACRALGIEEIVDIGARTAPAPERVGEIRVTAMGHLAPERVSALLGGARAGFIDYPSDYLGKSTVFAAYAAHGLVPVVAWRRGEDEPGLAEGRNYWVPSATRTAQDAFAQIASAAARWYSDHALAAQARAYAGLLQPGSA